MDRTSIDRISGDTITSSPEEGSIPAIRTASRRSGFVKLRADLLQEPTGILLLTGESGAGKTWLWNQIADSLPLPWRTLAVSLTGVIGPSEFTTLVFAGLEIDPPSNLALARIKLTEALQDESADGRSWILVVEDAHRATPAVWEEIRVLSNAIGGNGGFAGIVLIAQTELVRLLSRRELASVACRISSHVHLPPLDLDECQDLMEGLMSEGVSISQLDAIGQIHRDTRGNSAEIVREVSRLKKSGRVDRTTKLVEEKRIQTDFRSIMAKGEKAIAKEIHNPTQPAPVAPDQARTPRPAPVSPVQAPSSASIPLVPSRPPLRLEDGLIEVGWQEEPETATSITSSESMIDAPRIEQPLKSEEWVNDPYAAIQAWAEWAKHHESETPTAPSRESFESTGSEPGDEKSKASRTNVIIPDAGLGTTIRAEAPHEFSPYGPLFNENRKSKQS